MNLMKRSWTVGVLAALGTLGAAPADLGLPAEVAGYYTWERGNAQKSLAESAHPVAKDIYLDEAAVAAARGSSFPYRAGSTLVKERMDPATLQVTTLYAMRKVAGFSPEDGDWQYGVFEREAAGAFSGGWMSAENAGMCSGCHVQAASTDYTFLSYLDE